MTDAKEVGMVFARQMVMRLNPDSSALSVSLRPSPHHNNFDFLRFLLAVGVIVSHAYPLLLGAGTPEPLAKLLSRQADLGKICVEGFFVISGFLVTSSFVRSSTALDYLRKRSLRIFPGLAAALLMCVFVVAPLGGASFPSYLHDKRGVSSLAQVENQSSELSVSDIAAQTTAAHCNKTQTV